MVTNHRASPEEFFRDALKINGGLYAIRTRIASRIPVCFTWDFHFCERELSITWSWNGKEIYQNEARAGTLEELFRAVWRINWQQEIALARRSLTQEQFNQLLEVRTPCGGMAPHAGPPATGECPSLERV